MQTQPVFHWGIFADDSPVPLNPQLVSLVKEQHPLPLLAQNRVKDLVQKYHPLLLLFSHSAVSDFDPHGLQHARLLCPPLSLRVCSNSCPQSQ